MAKAPHNAAKAKREENVRTDDMEISSKQT
jgi:hypothetical protein